MPKPAKGDKLGDVQVRGTAPDPGDRHHRRPGDARTSAPRRSTARIQGSDLLTFDSTEHTAFGRGISTCIDDAVVAYLVDGTLPPPGTHCAPD